MRSRSLLPLAFASTFASVLDLPIWVRNTYSVVEVNVGSPPVPHFLLFDTGSATTWMVDAECVESDTCHNGSGYPRTGYSATASSTSEPMNTTTSIDYLGGVTSGSGILDVFTLPTVGNCSSPFSWTQSFLSANQSSWTTLPSDGFLGLAFSSIADANTTTLVETLMQDGLLDSTRFGLYLGTETNDTGAGAGNGLLTLGGSHEDVYSVEGSLAALNWSSLQVPGEDAQLWRTSMQYTVGKQAKNDTKHTVTALGSWAVFDTGAGRISVPDDVIEEIYASIGMNWTAILNHDVIPLCADFTDDWYLDVFFGDSDNPTQVRITGAMLKTPGFATGEDKYCWPPFDPSGVSGLFLMGAQFLQNYYTVFDFGGSEPANYSARIGFGRLKDEYKPVVGSV
ncbi:pepsinogen c [Ophiostoma piceae UAMH 11346]|uniref:Pepsinogen c n=1 Tax=Ophiostoma piceae (strain UAMH 11346) TaxID=1262450 RepID=S3CB08_OPHP1|nr:pepsinogen c [Ophiostoma piceae UAMH 11346]